MKLSIITINYNNADGLSKTIESVLTQTCRDFEYIVIDGASTDNSVDIIRASALQAEGLTFTWVSEKDTGIYNAMNKGIEIASGLRVVNALNRSERSEDKNKGIEIASGLRVVNALNRSERSEDKHGEADRPEQSGVENKELPEYVLMLNSGDYLVDEHVIERIMPELDGTDIVQGNNIEERAKGIYRNRGYGKSDIDLFDVMKGHFLHQSSFCRRDLFERYGYFDESYKMSADTKFFMICLGQKDATFKYVDIDVANYDMSGISAERKGHWAQCHREELGRIRKEVFSGRMFTFMLENDKKVRLYNELHAHKWIWNLTMVVANVRSWIYGNTQDVKIEKIK